MMRMFKYTVFVGDGDINVEMPKDAVIRHIGHQNQLEICIWAEVVNTQATSLRTFRVYGTGHEVAHGGDYLGTVIDGQFVWHLYEQLKP